MMFWFDVIDYDWRRELMTVFVYFFLVILFFGMYTEYLWKSPLDKALQFLFIYLLNLFTERKQTPRKQKNHRAMDDIRESIKELQYYKDNIFKSRQSKQ